jgi:hypothetical protein
MYLVFSTYFERLLGKDSTKFRMKFRENRESERVFAGGQGQVMSHVSFASLHDVSRGCW